MKKLISLALTLAILASLAISVSAAGAVADKEDLIVGNAEGTGIDIGIPGTAFTDKVGNTTISIDASVGTIQSRYAVDIEYETLLVNVAGEELVWDVTKLEYVPNGSASENVPDLADRTADVTITNYSDKAVYVTTNVTDVHPDDFLDVTVSSAATSAGANKYEIPRATAKTATADGEASVCTFTMTVEADDAEAWADAASYYAAYFAANSGSSTPIATITFTVSKA